jgi:hypothetical protein
VWGPRQDIDRISFMSRDPSQGNHSWLASGLEPKLSFLQSSYIQGLFGILQVGGGLIRSIEAKKNIPKKRKKPDARAEERKKCQTALTTLVSTGTGRDEKGAPIQASLVHWGPVKPMAFSRRLKSICHVILNLKGLKYEIQMCWKGFLGFLWKHTQRGSIFCGFFLDTSF